MFTKQFLASSLINRRILLKHISVPGFETFFGKILTKLKPSFLKRLKSKGIKGSTITQPIDSLLMIIQDDVDSKLLDVFNLQGLLPSQTSVSSWHSKFKYRPNFLDINL